MDERKTFHRVVTGDARNMQAVASDSVDLVVTSPPYPMVEMWDESFGAQNPQIADALLRHDGMQAFELMNQVLDHVWNEAFRVLKSGGIACINIGDATRTINGCFMLYPNHARILSHCHSLGFQVLPAILWRKQTNAPNKFMGSGMMPPGAYVTLEHEFILILRKGGKRAFSDSDEKCIRQESSYFWEERNVWFSDLWTDLKGALQKLSGENSRERSAAFPFELAYRLINMYSVKGDTILDPFLGTGTTTLAAITACRNSIGYEIASDLKAILKSSTAGFIDLANTRILTRLEKHRAFVAHRSSEKGPLKYTNAHYRIPVMTRQERDIFFNPLRNICWTSDQDCEVAYDKVPPLPDAPLQSEPIAFVRDAPVTHPVAEKEDLLQQNSLQRWCA